MNRFHLFLLILKCKWNIILGEITPKVTSNLCKLQENAIFSSIFYDHNVVRSYINYRIKNRGNTNNLRLNSTKFQFEFNKIQRFLGKK